MKWKLQSEENNTRIYENDQNSSTIQTNLIYTDKLDNRWYGFADLFTIPAQRVASSQMISDLFKTGISPFDLKRWIKDEKELLQANKIKNDPEIYEKLYSLILEKERAVNNTVDPLQEHLALCTIYVLGESEIIDRYNVQDAEKKLDVWKLDQDAQNFFLLWHIERTANFIKNLDEFSQIALKSNNLMKS